MEKTCWSIDLGRDDGGKNIKNTSKLMSKYISVSFFGSS